MTSKMHLSREAIASSVPERFAEVVHAYPEHLAVESDHHRLTYAALYDRALAVARTLRAYPDKRVALLFDHDAPMIAAILGTLAAGKAYVPLDPTHPEKRLGSILADA